jgi:hypothetical protein
MIFGLLTFLMALTISGVAIYYSVAGLVAIFAAAPIPIIIMGSALEVGKLVTAVWLHRYWEKAKWWLKLYLSVAVLVLMFITSMGIFGFLSKAHIEQTSAAEAQVALLERFDEEILRQQEIISRAEQRIIKAEEDAQREDIGIQEKINAEQERIDSAYNRRQPSIDEQTAIIQAQELALQGRISVYEDEISSLDIELSRLNDLVNEYREQLSNTSVASVEEQIQPYIDQIAQLDVDIARLDNQAAAYEARISELAVDDSVVQSLRDQIAAIEDSIVVTTNKLQSTERDKIREGQAVIGVTSDGLFGSNTRRALEAWVTAQQDRIASLQAQETQVRAQAQDTVNDERTRLTNLVSSLRGDQTEAVQERKQALLDTIGRIRTDAASGLQAQRDSIQTKIDAVLNVDIPANREARRIAQNTITELRNSDDIVVDQAREEIARIRQLAEDEIAQAQAVIERLRAEITVGEDTDLDAIVDEQNARITQANNEIDTITEEKFALQAEVRKLEAEVGPVKYLAEFIYQDAERDTLEEAVRWVIVTIIFVFDPLAVALLIAAQYVFEWRKKDNQTEVDDASAVLEQPKEKEVEKVTKVTKPKKTIKKAKTEEELWKNTSAGKLGIKDPLAEVVNPLPDNKQVDIKEKQSYNEETKKKIYGSDGKLIQE